MASHFDTTLRDVDEGPDEGPPRLHALTMLFHPDTARIGETVRLTPQAAVSRTEPGFSAPGGPTRAPLADPFLSRKPLRLATTVRGDFQLTPDRAGTEVKADGEPITSAVIYTRAKLERGVVIELANRIVLLWHLTGPQRENPARLGMIGENDQLCELRNEILRVADLSVPILVTGESGVGKELVARAIHDRSARSAGPYVCVNLAAIPPTMAASELFGHAQGAFTGAAKAHDGYFAQAHGGTLFLDEVGDTPADVQAMLLRAIETSEIRPVGSEASRKLDVRLVTATDTDLETAVEERAFRLPLYHRLSGYRLAVPSLRDRRDDIGRLFIHFLRKELDELGLSEKLRPPEPGKPSWIPAALVSTLARYSWPGNIRELRNVIRQLIIASRDTPRMRIPPALGPLLEATAIGEARTPLPGGVASGASAGSTSGERATTGAPPRHPSTITEDELIETLRAHRWRVGAAAAALDISRTTAYALIDKSDRIRKARDVSEEQILACRNACGGDLDAMAHELEISKRGLQLRMRELGIR